MLNNLSKVFISAIICIISGCQVIPQRVSEPLLIINPDVIYNGNGAATGLALSSAMGPTGFAIGIAIDEGIKKNIQTVVKQQNFSPLIYTEQFKKELISNLFLQLSYSAKGPSGTLTPTATLYCDVTANNSVYSVQGTSIELTEFRNNKIEIKLQFAPLIEQQASWINKNKNEYIRC